MARTTLPFPVRIKSLLASHPVLANWLMRILGARRVEKIARRSAIRAARQAYAYVPFYHRLFEEHGFDSRRMQKLNWKDFQRLPTSDKVQTSIIPDYHLLDTRLPSPTADALIGRSSGTSNKPAFWHVGWNEFWMLRAVLWGMLHDLGASKKRTAVITCMAVDGGDLAGAMVLFPLFSVKEQTHWPIQTFAGGEDPDDLLLLIRWLSEQDYERLMLVGFPGSVERLLDRAAYARSTDPSAGVDWSRFERIRVSMGGQLISAELRQRIHQEMGVSAYDLIPVYASSDGGQVMMQSTPFTIWLESYLQTHPDLYETLNVPEEHRTKPLMECVSPFALYIEQDSEDTVLLTAWKHRPLIRYRTHDLAWMRPTHDIVRTLNRHARDWRRDFKNAGFGTRNIPKVSYLAMILGRADDIRIVNAANISPEVLKSALADSGILPHIHHFKHDTVEARPNVYLVYLELPNARDEADRCRLADQWRRQLLSALITQPGATDLAAAHRANPIELEVLVRSRGEDEFEGDDQHIKKLYVPRQHKTPARTANVGDVRDSTPVVPAQASQ